MVSAQKMLSKKNIKKFPQCVTEGHTPDKYNIIPTNPSFATKGQRSSLSNSNEPEFIDNDFGGVYDRKGVIKTREKNTVTYRGRFLDVDLDILKWAANLPDGAGTPDESRTWLDSYENTDGTEIYRIWKGCKVLSSSIIISSTDVIMLEIVMSAKEYLESDIHGITLGSGSFATVQPDGTPLRFKDLGKFVYGTDEINFRNCTITTTFTQKMQDSNGSETDLYTEPSTRRITGSVDIFKKNQNLNEDARLGIQKYGYFVLHDKSGVDDSATKRIPTAGNPYITFLSKIPGTFGNGISIEVKTGNAASTTVTIDENLKIIITLKTGGSTLTQIKAAMDAHDVTKQLVKSTITGTASTNQTVAVASSNLIGGTDIDTKLIFSRLRWLPSSEDLIEQSEATIESKSLESDVIQVVSA